MLVISIIPSRSFGDQMDPLSDVLSLLKPRSYLSAGFDDGGGVFLAGSRFAVAGSHAGFLLGMLPPIVHIHRQSEQAALRCSVERMMEEMHDGQPGGFLIAQHLAHMMLVQALRMHLAEGGNGGANWFASLADRQVGAAIKAIHADPAYRWTLQKLARHAGMSRSTFARGFGRQRARHLWNISRAGACFWPQTSSKTPAIPSR